MRYEVLVNGEKCTATDDEVVALTAFMQCMKVNIEDGRLAKVMVEFRDYTDNSFVRVTKEHGKLP